MNKLARFAWKALLGATLMLMVAAPVQAAPTLTFTQDVDVFETITGVQAGVPDTVSFSLDVLDESRSLLVPLVSVATFSETTASGVLANGSELIVEPITIPVADLTSSFQLVNIENDTFELQLLTATIRSTTDTGRGATPPTGVTTGDLLFTANDGASTVALSGSNFQFTIGDPITINGGTAPEIDPTSAATPVGLLVGTLALALNQRGSTI